MAAWSDDLAWAPQRYDRLEAMIDWLVATEGFYPDMTLDDLSVDDPVTAGDETGDDRPATERLAA